MKNSKLKISLLFISLTLLVSIRPALALNQYSVDPEAHFRWDATKYYFMRDGLGLGNNLEYTQNYFLEFNFTNWGGVSGAEYLNGTINNNGTVYDGEISHASYYFGTPSQSWITEIIDASSPYPVHVYLVCNTEIDQTTKLDLQDADTHPDLTFNEISIYNYSLTGSFSSPTGTYSGRFEFNSDKVLKYVFDEFIIGSNDVIERYTWTLTYTPGTSTSPSGDTIPGFSIFSIISIITIGVLISRRKRIVKFLQK
jgi:hypothetical protein